MRFIDQLLHRGFTSLRILYGLDDLSKYGIAPYFFSLVVKDFLFDESLLDR